MRLLRNVFKRYLNKLKLYYIELADLTVNEKKLYPQLYILKIVIPSNFCLVSLFTKRIKVANQIYAIFVSLDVFAIIQVRIPVSEN